ncbi:MULTISPECIES: putative holin-like toxin [Lactobacillus]|nr:hypothetical protein [Lactobacillus kullabergensis]RMC52915.1 hypothetical protein F5ESL0261_09155 [Lactobacillus sp. ESL0261]
MSVHQALQIMLAFVTFTIVLLDYINNHKK